MEYLNRTELAKAFKVSLTTVDTWLRRGMPYVKGGGNSKQWKFDLEEVKGWREIQNHPKIKSHSCSHCEDLSLNPATILHSAAVLSFSMWLSEKLNIDSKKLKKLAFEWIKNKPKDIIEMEDNLNDWLKNGA